MRKSHKYCLVTVLFTLFMPLVAEAQFKTIVSGIKSKSLDIARANVEREQSKNNMAAVESQNLFYLSADATQYQGTSTSLFGFQSQETKTLSPTITLGKAFSWGGQLTFSHGLQIYDISDWNTTLLTPSVSGSSEAFIHSNTLSYEQDLGKNFFGKAYRSQLTQAEILKAISIDRFKSVESETLYRLFSIYIQAKLNKTLVNLASESMKRAEKRKNLIGKRYKDGISIKADSLRAQNAFLQSKEFFEDANTQMTQQLEKLNLELGDVVPIVRIQSFSGVVNIGVPPRNLDIIKKENPDLKVLKKRLELARAKLEESESKDNFDLSLNLSYSRAAISGNSSDSLDKSFDDDTFDEKTASLTLTIPFGKSADDYTRMNESLNVRVAELEEKRFYDNLGTREDNLRTELDKLSKNVNSSKERMKFNQSILKEQNKRYNRGQVDLDQVLSAEEDLLASERSYYQYLASLTLLKANLNYLYGTLEKSLMNYNE